MGLNVQKVPSSVPQFQNRSIMPQQDRKETARVDGQRVFYLNIGRRGEELIELGSARYVHQLGRFVQGLRLNRVSVRVSIPKAENMLLPENEVTGKEREFFQLGTGSVKISKKPPEEVLVIKSSWAGSTDSDIVLVPPNIVKYLSSRIEAEAELESQ